MCWIENPELGHSDENTRKGGGENLSEQYREDLEGFKKDLTQATANFMALRKQSKLSEKRKRA